MDPTFLWTRRRLMAGAVGAAMFSTASAEATPTDYYVLSNAAIPVRSPAKVLLEAVARAGNRLVAVGEHGVIIYSDDNGTTWRQAHVPVDVTINCVSFATPSVGWAAGHFGVILKTNDGGLNWQKQLDGVQANQLTLASAQAAVAAQSTLPTVAHAMRRANIFVQDGPNKPLLSLVVFDTQKVIVFGSYRLTLLTLDGGKTWQDLSLYVADPVSHNLYAAALIDRNIFVAGEAGEVFLSIDGGATFPAVESPTPATLFDVLGASDGSIIVCGVAGTIFRSGDHGKTWRQVSLDSQDDLTAAYRLSSGEIIIGTAAGGLFMSKDNGLNFGPVSGGPAMAVFGIGQAADGAIVFVGDPGVARVPLTSLTS